MSSVTAWVDLEGTRLSEISQPEKDEYWMISLICGIQESGAHRNRELNGGYQGPGKRADLGQRVQTSSKFWGAPNLQHG